MNNCFIILAAGESKRFKSKTPKPYYLYRGKPLFLHSLDKAKESNKFKKIRAAVCYSAKSTKLSRSHNNANIIAIGSRLTNKNLALKLVMIFLKTKFDGGRHKRRTNKI